MREDEAKFHVGQLVTHLKFGYRGVVFDVDPVFSNSEAWYAAMARSQPPKDKPWYHVLVDGASHATYVAERHLAPDNSGQPVAHPLLGSLFSGFENGRYTRQFRPN